MNTPEPLQHCRIGIVGLGLMGGSLALALRGKCIALYGIDTDPQVVDQALDAGMVDWASILPGDLPGDTDLMILAAPVQGIIQILGQLPGWYSGSATVMDIGSTKVEILKAMQGLPERFDVLGGHPMCGKEHGSLANAEAGLFKGANFILTALPRTSQGAATLAEQLVRAVDANPIWLPAEVHDRWVAFTSHVPYLLANALAANTPAEAQGLIGPGLRSTSRLAATPLSIIVDILATNRSNVLNALHSFRSQLDQLANSLELGDWSRLLAALETGRSQYEQVIAPAPDLDR